MSIQYNVLNLPSEIEFEDGHSIKYIRNVYAADGRKLSSFYIVNVMPTLEPLELSGKNLQNLSGGKTKNLPITEVESGTHYIGNFEYLLGEKGVFEKTRIHNAEGYNENGNWYCFRKDHLGNNREVCLVNGTTMQTVQTNNYYPSGLPWAEDVKLSKSLQSMLPYTQPYKYNGKEYIEMGGYDIYDYGFRGYYATIGRFTSIDALAEKYYGISPYAYTLNNPIRWIDIDGFEPGDLFNTELEAVIDFAVLYNGTSIKENREFITLIYQNEDGTYSYTVPVLCHEASTFYTKGGLPDGATLVAFGHTHGKHIGGIGDIYESNEMADRDIKTAKEENVNMYVVLPTGWIRKYDVTTKKDRCLPAKGAAKQVPSQRGLDGRATNVDEVDKKPIYRDAKKNMEIINGEGYEIINGRPVKTNGSGGSSIIGGTSIYRPTKRPETVYDPTTEINDEGIITNPMIIESGGISGKNKKVVFGL